MAKKKLDMLPYAPCPQCGKENMVRASTDAGWCNEVHKKNYEFQHRSDDRRFS